MFVCNDLHGFSVYIPTGLISFAQIATIACSLTIKDFPAVTNTSFAKYNDTQKEKVHKWIERNPTYTVRISSPQEFLKKTPLQNILSAMNQAYAERGQ